MQAVFFDLDGTLCDTLGDLTASVNYALRTLDFPVYSEAEVCQMVGNGARILCERAVPSDRNDAVGLVLAYFRSHYAAHCTDRTKAYPEMTETLEQLKNAGLLLGVITNKPHASAVRIIEHLFPKGLFSFVLGQTDAFPIKPDPASLLASMRTLSLTPRDVTYVGDSDVDLAFAKNAGVPAIGCAWGFRGRAFLASHGAEQIIDHPSELYQLLTR